MSDQRNTPMTFSRDEMRLIRDMMATPRARLACPLCGETLLLIGPIIGDGTWGRMFEVTCKPCSRTSVITEAAGTSRPEE